MYNSRVTFEQGRWRRRRRPIGANGIALGGGGRSSRRDRVALGKGVERPRTFDQDSSGFSHDD